MKLALRVEVATLRGTREAAPRLAALLQEQRAGATFLFNLGPDRTGRALSTLPAGVPRLESYGLRALVSGTLLPGPDAGLQCRDVMRSVGSQGFETGVLAYDRADWVRRVARADERWTREAMQRARARYEEIFEASPMTHGAPSWRMNRYAFRHAQRLGYRHCSDTRGTGPFIPVLQGEIAACPQVPTTMPTLDELLVGGLGPDRAVERLLELSREPPAEGHVFTLRAEIEGTVFEPLLRALLAGWRELGCSLVSLRDYAAGLDLARLPRCVVVEQAVPGAPGLVSAQGREFLT